MDRLDQRASASAVELGGQPQSVLVLPDKTVPNLGSKALRLVLDRLSADWQARYGHPVLVVETFVDPDQFCGTVYTANGWQELGQTDGWGRHRRDYYVKHDKPKRLFVRELRRHARRSLQAEHLKPDLATVEAQVPARCTLRVKEIQSLSEQFKQVPEYRDRVESYPLWSLLTLVLLAVLCEAPEARRTWRSLRGVSVGGSVAPWEFAEILKANIRRPISRPFVGSSSASRAAKSKRPSWRSRSRCGARHPKKTWSFWMAKNPSTAVVKPSSVPSPFPASFTWAVPSWKRTRPTRSRWHGALFERLDLEGRLVSLDALHTQDETARALVLEHGAGYLLTVKDNQPTVHENLQKLIAAPEADFPPL